MTLSHPTGIPSHLQCAISLQSTNPAAVKVFEILVSDGAIARCADVLRAALHSRSAELDPSPTLPPPTKDRAVGWLLSCCAKHSAEHGEPEGAAAQAARCIVRACCRHLALDGARSEAVLKLLSQIAALQRSWLADTPV